jgi:hypothetical protein
MNRIRGLMYENPNHSPVRVLGPLGYKKTLSLDHVLLGKIYLRQDKVTGKRLANGMIPFAAKVKDSDMQIFFTPLRVSFCIQEIIHKAYYVYIHYDHVEVSYEIIDYLVKRCFYFTVLDSTNVSFTLGDIPITYEKHKKLLLRDVTSFIHGRNQSNLCLVHLQEQYKGIDIGSPDFWKMPESKWLVDMFDQTFSSKTQLTSGREIRCPPEKRQLRDIVNIDDDQITPPKKKRITIVLDNSDEDNGYNDDSQSTVEDLLNVDFIDTFVVDDTPPFGDATTLISDDSNSEGGTLYSFDVIEGFSLFGRT